MNPQKDNKNILIIMSGLDLAGVGEQFLKSMLTDYSPKAIYRFSLINADKNVPTYRYYVKTHKILSHNLPIISSIDYWFSNNKNLHSWLKQINFIISEHNIKAIWIILNSIQVIQLASILVSYTKLPYIVQIWDLPEYIAKSSHLDLCSTNNLMRKFKKVITDAKLCVTISEFMSRLYNERYKVESKTMFFTSSVDNFLSFDKKKKYTKKCQKIKIVFAGSLYAYDSWNAFLDAIEIHNAKRKENEIDVLCIGNVSRWARKRSWVKYSQLMAPAAAMDIINRSDIAYLPYWMSKKYSDVVQTSFPSKLSFYISSGTPIFYHGPEFSTPTNFLKNYPVGLSCHSLNANDILALIFKLLSLDFLSQYTVSQNKVKKDIFDKNESSKIFAEIINNL